MTDFDESEISAVENVFTDATVLLCDFHRNQAWERWTKKKENSMDKAPEILKHLKQLAHAPNQKLFDVYLQRFCESEVWKCNAKFQRYFQSIWLPHKKRWCKLYRMGTVEIVAGTNNYLECHHRILKRSYLHGKSSYSLSSMLRILIDEFFPSRYRAYVDKNQKLSGKFRSYSTDVPTQLQNRPRDFVKHCLESLESSKSVKRDEVQSIEAGIFQVHTGSTSYQVFLDDDTSMPSCECNDWYKYHMPCRYMVTAITMENEVQWHQLSPLYMQSVYCTVDDFEDIASCTDTGIKEEYNTVQKDPAGVAEEEQYASIETCQVKTRDVIKKLLNITYNINDQDKLNRIEHTVCSLINDVQPTETVPLLLLPKRLTKKLRKQRKAGKISKTRAPPVPDKVETVEVDDDFIMEEDCKVRKLWALPQSFNVPVGKVYGTCVTNIRSLEGRSWLTDNVIDTYLRILTTELEEAGSCKCLHIPSSTIGQIVSGQYKSRMPYKLRDLKYAVGAYIRWGHWTIVVLDVAEEVVYFYNPTGAEDGEIAHIKSSMCGFIAKCNNEDESAIRTRWRTSTVPHASQLDSFNCGVYFLIFAERHLKGQLDELMTINNYTLKDTRMRVASKLMMFEELNTMRKKQKYCVCDRADDGNLYWQCDECQDWYHPDCLNLNPEEEPEKFICQFCQKKSVDIIHMDISSDSEDEENDNITFNEEEDLLFEDLQKIMSCDSDNCSEDSHVRHHEFCANPLKYLRVQRKMCGFGYNKFSTRTIDNLTKHLMTGLVVNKYVDKRRPYTGGTYNDIKNLDHSKLHKVLKYYACIADKYIMFVTLKETQIFLTMKHLDIGYKEAETILLKAEVNRDIRTAFV